MKKVIIVTDSWLNYTSGVVTLLIQEKKALEERGFEVHVIHPGDFKTFPLPTYPDIRLALVGSKKIADIIKKEKPDYIHIPIEGTLGLAARRACVKNNWKFTTHYHTDLPEYVKLRLKFNFFKKLTIAYLRWFHKKSSCVIVNTNSMKEQLEARGFKNIKVVSPGVDTSFFVRNPSAVMPVGLKKPVFVFLGRVAIEKNIDAFLECDLPGSKLIIGDGPARESLENKFGTQAKFVGFKKGQEIVDLLSICDVFVFPSKTDTFGLVLVEALSCGLPVAGYNVRGPKDIVTNGVDGYLGDDLAGNAIKCLDLDPMKCRVKALEFSIEKSGDKFAASLVHV